MPRQQGRPDWHWPISQVRLPRSTGQVYCIDTDITERGLSSLSIMMMMIMMMVMILFVFSDCVDCDVVFSSKGLKLASALNGGQRQVSTL